MRCDRAALAETPNSCALHFARAQLPTQEGSRAEKGIKGCKENRNPADVTWDLSHECFDSRSLARVRAGNRELTKGSGHFGNHMKEGALERVSHIRC